MSTRPIHVFMPLPLWGNGPPETCYRICSHWPGLGQPTRIYTAACIRSDSAKATVPVLPNGLPRRVRGRLASMPRLLPHLRARSERQGLEAVESGDICYMWPGTSIETIAAAKARGGRIVLEFINTHVAYAKRLLDAECDRVGAPAYPHFTESCLAEEAERLALSDAAFAPGPFVEPSIVACSAHVPTILPTSYGAYLPTGYPFAARPAQAGTRLRFLFVGTVSIRKGVHTLLDAWARAALPAAELLIVGAPEPHMVETYLGRLPANVTWQGHTHDIDAVYRAADVFVFPSLEEGGPQVTYEATAYGLPLIVTAMGGGRIAVEGRNALVVAPGDADGLAQALVSLHANAGLRGDLGAAASADAAQFEWPLVAGRRQAALAALRESVP